MSFRLCCPICEASMQEDTASGEEFSCPRCQAMLDIIDAELAMLSLPPHENVTYILTAKLRWLPVIAVH
ncbi:MAG: hypothetical protein HY692_04030 [Cyanobacteria bacterium NC_groundwater_1444_Ag_S-0.65um_54_12]|nr:hypothetical protein [Cyanobacteria bacterium NC_groundwater_1444_Ag_S-0.65um_54_12]